MMYTGMGFSFMIDVYWFKLSFTILEAVGTCICLFFIIFMALFKHYCSKKDSAK